MRSETRCPSCNRAHVVTCAWSSETGGNARAFAKLRDGSGHRLICAACGETFVGTDAEFGACRVADAEYERKEAGR